VINAVHFILGGTDSLFAERNRYDGNDA